MSRGPANAKRNFTLLAWEAKAGYFGGVVFAFTNLTWYSVFVWEFHVSMSDFFSHLVLSQVCSVVFMLI